MRQPRKTALFIVLIALLAIASCAQEQYPEAVWQEQHPTGDADGGLGSDASVVQGTRACWQPRAEALPQRLVAMSNSVQSNGTLTLTSDLFQRFNDTCKPCHTAAAENGGQGGFQIKSATEFTSKMVPSVIEHVTKAVCPKNPDPNDPDDPMPPCTGDTPSMSFVLRAETDPVKQFAELVTQWLAMGSPASFTAVSGNAGTDVGAGDAGSASPYALTPAQGNAMTNLGTCVPSTAMVGIEDAKSEALDAKFAAMQALPSGTAAQAIGLPEDLGDTDLVTLDSATLAESGVVAYQPAYPLWSDNAGKLRYVRVPRGQSIHFDKVTQQFEIPANTRFYKTFMKQVIDDDGSYRWRKIETRLIVSRPDQNNPDGTAASQTALFGTYQWNADESKATLVETPLNNSLPFSDTLLLYDTDQPLAADLLQAKPAAPDIILVEGHAARHYAIPSSQRCIQCHMGSPSQSFVLGFTPLQINRRPSGTGGTDPTRDVGPDELTQMQRLIDAGIITGIDSATDVLPLEQSQGNRAPRNPSELRAQGYMLGNCAHCHNPRGFPTIQNPVLQGVLDFLPSEEGGIFQFPLERTSPRIGRGTSGTTPIPYITPSLVDLPRTDTTGNQAGDIFVLATAGGVTAERIFYAPWRSLIYRNVDDAFAYVDDLALFPHMPFNTPGYDPVARQVISDWMVSIPAVRKRPDLVEYAYRVDGQQPHNIGSPTVDTSPQPYAEVTPGAPGYDDAVTAANVRLGILHTGVNPAVTLDPEFGISVSRYSYPESTETDDILDPAVQLDPVCHPVPTPATGDLQTSPVPDHPHWVNTDLTNAPGAYSPRGLLWKDVLVERTTPQLGSGCKTPASVQGAYADQLDAIGLVQSASLDQVRDYVMTPQPFGLWQQQPGCDFSSAPSVQSFSGHEPHWMVVAPKPAANAPVYMQTPGEAVFKMICINCHGPKADSNGRLAQNLATMTGGSALVADFRDGLFGPVGAPEETSNRHAVFGLTELPSDAVTAATQWTQVTDDDRAARYMSWMGLGGTSVIIPDQLLEIVAVTKVLDQQRVLLASQLSANMLSQAKALCMGLLGPVFAGQISNQAFIPGAGHGIFDEKTFTNALIRENYDAELWLRLCTLENPPPIHVLTLGDNGALGLVVNSPYDGNENLAVTDSKLFWSGDFPAAGIAGSVGIGNDRGTTDPALIPCTSQNLDTCNKWPWCVDDGGATPGQEAWIDANGIPRCPQAVKDATVACYGGSAPAFGTCVENEDANRWAVRGAINAGMSVFLYVQSLETSTPPPDFNQCTLLR